MTLSPERAIAERARTQLGHITRRQYLDLGLTYSALAHRTRTGLHRQVGSGTFRLQGAPDGRRADVMAACLDLGAVASHRTAAWLHGLDGFGPPTRIEVLVPKGRRVANDLAIVHQTTNLGPDDIVTVDGIPSTSIARTILGLAALVPAEVPREALVGAVEVAVRQRKASDRWLWWLLEERRCRGRNGVGVMEDVLAQRARLGPTESWLERETLRVLAAAGLPAPTVQRRVRDRGRFVSRVDLVYDAAKVAIEVEGKDHLTPEQHRIDARQRNELQLLGYTILTFTYTDVVGDPSRVVRTVRRALEQQMAA